MADQGGQSQQTGSRGQQIGSAGGDVKQLTVGQLLDIAAQNNMDVSALNNLVGDIQAEVDAGNVAVGGDSGEG